MEPFLLLGKRPFPTLLSSIVGVLLVDYVHCVVPHWPPVPLLYCSNLFTVPPTSLFSTSMTIILLMYIANAGNLKAQGSLFFVKKCSSYNIQLFSYLPGGCVTTVS